MAQDAHSIQLEAGVGLKQYLLRHGMPSQLCVSCALPLHLAPPFSGGGLVHVR